MIILKGEPEISKIRSAGEIVAKVLVYIRDLVGPGVSLIELDKAAYKKIRELGGYPAFLGYRGYPSSICTSLNDEVIHGLPDSRKVNEGDLLKIDIGVRYDDCYCDGAICIVLPGASQETTKLKEFTEEILYEAISVAQPGGRLFDISATIEGNAKAQGYNVVKQFGGHGVGLQLHEDPQVPNSGRAGRGARLREGMIFCIEPMITPGSGEVYIAENGWTVMTVEGEVAGHAEHAVLITKDGPEILTPWHIL